jgi:hypothetical protein
MNKLDSQPASPTLSTISPSTPGPAGWLIVLLPSVEADLTTATHRVAELANAGGKRVRFIGLYESAAQELRLRRQMAGMSGMMVNAGIYTETEAISGKNWVEAVRSYSQAGDMVVCFAQQQVGPFRRSLSDVLQASLDVPVYILSEPHFQKNERFNWPTQLLAWAGFLAIIGGFLLLQVRMHPLTDGWVRTALVLISVTLEFWMIWAWNSLFG